MSGNTTFSSVLTYGVHVVRYQQHVGYNLFREQQQVGHLLKNYRRAPPLTQFSFLPFRK